MKPLNDLVQALWTETMLLAHTPAVVVILHFIQVKLSSIAEPAGRASMRAYQMRLAPRKTTRYFQSGQSAIAAVAEATLATSLTTVRRQRVNGIV